MKNRDTKQWLVLGLFVAAAVCSLLGKEVSNQLRRVVHYALSPLGDAGMYLATSIRARAGDLDQRPLSREDAQKLMEEKAVLERELAATIDRYENELRLRGIKYGNGHDKGLYGAMGDFPCELVAAKVVAADALPYGSTRLVNVGSDRGAANGSCVTTKELITDRSKAMPPNLAVISTTAVVGRLMAAGQYTAVLQLVTDPGYEATAMVTRSGRNGPRLRSAVLVQVRGDGQGLVALNVPATHGVRVGDDLVTSGDSGFLPERVYIAKVTEVLDEPKSPGMQSLRFRPLADLTTLREVYVVIPLQAAMPPTAKGK